MFANEDFVEASRQFVCIRIETYENKEAEERVRSLLNGRFANTAFCIFDPQGTRRLTRSGRGPSSALAGRGRGKDSTNDSAVIQEMNRIAKRYRSRGNDQQSVLQDFLSFRQALNVASADQRLLVFVNADEESREQAQSNLQRVFADDQIIGKFHLNFMDPKKDRNWSKQISGNTKQKGIYIIRSGTFGLDGNVMAYLSPDSTEKEIKEAMIRANDTFARSEKRKVYSQHVMAGKRQGVYFENEIPYGEDRDGDGKKDKPNRRGRR